MRAPCGRHVQSSNWLHHIADDDDDGKLNRSHQQIIAVNNNHKKKIFICYVLHANLFNFSKRIRVGSKTATTVAGTANNSDDEANDFESTRNKIDNLYFRNLHLNRWNNKQNENWNDEGRDAVRCHHSRRIDGDGMKWSPYHAEKWCDTNNGKL